MRPDLVLALADWRDVFLIASSALLILLFIAMFVLVVVLFLATRALFGAVQSLMKEQVTPMAESGKTTLKRVEGTSTFISETAVKPVIRIYGIVSGARRAASVLVGFKSGRDSDDT